MEILKNHVANYNRAMAEKKYSQVASIAEIIMNLMEIRNFMY